MSYESLLPELCSIYRKTVDTTKKTTTEAWFLLESVKCRIIKKSMVKGNAEKAQYSTLVKTLFHLPKFCDVAIRDRIEHGGRRYDVVDVVNAFDRSKVHHRVAVCEVIAGAA